MRNNTCTKDLNGRGDVVNGVCSMLKLFMHKKQRISCPSNIEAKQALPGFVDEPEKIDLHLIIGWFPAELVPLQAVLHELFKRQVRFLHHSLDQRHELHCLATHLHPVKISEIEEEKIQNPSLFVPLRDIEARVEP